MSSRQKLTTRNQIIISARELFAKNGKKNVTMSDIATYAGKGRRTIYKYFIDKDELFQAVIENELDTITNQLQNINTLSLSPTKKIEIYIFTRLDAIKKSINRSGSLESMFFQNLHEVEKVRRSIDMTEIRIIKNILDDGIALGEFKNISSQWTAMLMLNALKGIEILYLNNNVEIYIQEHKESIMNILLHGLTKSNEN